MRLPRTARLAYLTPGRCDSRIAASRSANPRTPEAPSPSHSPSVWLSPSATYREYVGEDVMSTTTGSLIPARGSVLPARPVQVERAPDDPELTDDVLQSGAW